MTISEMIRLRLFNQNLSINIFKNPVDVIASMGAMQAQDYAMAKMAIGIRVPSATDSIIEKAIDNGKIIRTHILRPTWHFIAAKDIRWMMTLASPHMKKSLASSHRKLGLDDKLFTRSNRIIGKLLESGRHLTREEIMKELRKKGIEINSLRAIHIMYRSEIEMIACNGSRRGKQFTYAHFDSKVPSGIKMTREESLGELASRYFTSHGPATIQDFSWWSGLPVSDARKGLEMVKTQLKKVRIEGIEEKEYWTKNLVEKTKSNRSVYLLPAYDEFSVAYNDRSSILEKKYEKRAGNGIFFPTILIDGKISGIWKRTLGKNKIVIELYPFISIKRKKLHEISLFADRLGEFAGCPVEFVVRKT